MLYILFIGRHHREVANAVLELMHAHAMLPLIAVSVLHDICGTGRHVYVLCVLTIVFMLCRSLWTCSSSTVYQMDLTEGEVTTGAAGGAVTDLVEATGAVGVAAEALLCSMALRWMQPAASPWLLLIAAVKTSATTQLALSVWSMKTDLKDQVGGMEGATLEVVALTAAEATAAATLRRHKLSSHLQKPASQVS